MTTDYEPLRPFAATESQQRYLESLIEHGSYRRAVKALGINMSTFCKSIRRIRRNAALHGYSPDHDMFHTSGPAHIVKGVSTFYKGEEYNQWVKTDLKRDAAVELMRELVAELSSDIKPAKPVALKNQKQDDSLLSLYILTDIHFGMRSWGEETGTNWDLEIAEKCVLQAFGHLVATSPNAKTGYLLQLGDFLHYDGTLPITPTSKHVLDTDSRFPKILRTAIRVFRQCVNMMLAKHEKVLVLHCQGNHDPASSHHFQEWSPVLYENEPRVEIIPNPSPFHAYRHGQVLIGAHHGDRKTKLQHLVHLFQDRFRHLHGDTSRTYIHTGHYHRDELYSFGSTRAERHETLIAPDAFASNSGYQSDRSLKCITYTTRGEYNRNIFYPEVL